MVFSSPVFLFVFLPSLLVLFISLPARSAPRCSSSRASCSTRGARRSRLRPAGFDRRELVARARDRSRAGERERRALLALAIVVNLGRARLVQVRELPRRATRLPRRALGLPAPPVAVDRACRSASRSSPSRRSLRDRRLPRRPSPRSRNPLDLALYISLLPAAHRRPDRALPRRRRPARAPRPTRGAASRSGIWRFVARLGKKVLIADTVAARSADDVFDAAAAASSPPALAWLGVVCLHAARSTSTSRATRTWRSASAGCSASSSSRTSTDPTSRAVDHASSGGAGTSRSRRWFRDYLYIPLGGNRRAARRAPTATCRSSSCSAGSGTAPSWTFVVWGAYHGLFLSSIERSRRAAWSTAAARVGVATRLPARLVGWVFFRAAGPRRHASRFLRALLARRVRALGRPCEAAARATRSAHRWSGRRSRSRPCLALARSCSRGTASGELAAGRRRRRRRWRFAAALVLASPRARSRPAPTTPSSTSGSDRTLASGTATRSSRRPRGGCRYTRASRCVGGRRGATRHQLEARARIWPDPMVRIRPRRLPRKIDAYVRDHIGLQAALRGWNNPSRCRI